MRTRTRQQALYALADYILRPHKERKRGDTAAAAIEITELLDQLLDDGRESRSGCAEHLCARCGARWRPPVIVE